MRPTSNPCRPALPLALAASLALAACASGHNPPLLASVHKQAKAPVLVAVPTPVPPPGGAQPTVAGSGTSGAAEEDVGSVIYYDPDTYTVKDTYRPMLEAYAKRLMDDPDLHLRIDGHTDDNGPADYNLELARMRAQMVMKELVSRGVSPNQLQIVGHGKLRPKARAATAQASNRRVELTYR